MAPKNDYWTDERIAELKRRWAEDDSAGTIADALGGGVTRSAVLGKAHRLGLKKTEVPGSATALARHPALLDGFAPVPHRTGGCQWPKWPDHVKPDQNFCGKPVRAEGEPYCAAHAARAYRQINDPIYGENKPGRAA